MDIRFTLFDQVRSECVRRLTSSPRGSDLVIMSGVFFEGIQSISLGRGISFNQDCFISGYGGLHIGNDVSIGHRVTILTTEHMYVDSNLPIKRQQSELKSVTIGNNVWIGANVTILAGTEIPDGCIIGAGAIVTKKLEIANGIYIGNPARFFKLRF